MKRPTPGTSHAPPLCVAGGEAAAKHEPKLGWQPAAQ
jgi:hypothetical protein